MEKNKLDGIEASTVAERFRLILDRLSALKVRILSVPGDTALARYLSYAETYADVDTNELALIFTDPGHYPHELAAVASLLKSGAYFGASYRLSSQTCVQYTQFEKELLFAAGMADYDNLDIDTAIARQDWNRISDTIGIGISSIDFLMCWLPGRVSQAQLKECYKNMPVLDNQMRLVLDDRLQSITYAEMNIVDFSLIRHKAAMSILNALKLSHFDWRGF